MNTESYSKSMAEEGKDKLPLEPLNKPEFRVPGFPKKPASKDLYRNTTVKWEREEREAAERRREDLRRMQEKADLSEQAAREERQREREHLDRKLREREEREALKNVLPKDKLARGEADPLKLGDPIPEGVVLTSRRPSNSEIDEFTGIKRSGSVERFSRRPQDPNVSPKILKK
ncbi:MAG: hypothetical protein A2959_03760 [Candidatus Levybacteria bacterium RIFCSPLOWO2_01_FULL_38_23]|nr:MAG: hypothetical protein A2959_03760 [Candidatus Levybacteria bacterium RIFCSPLOWO2_01_FULL_38_23]